MLSQVAMLGVAGLLMGTFATLYLTTHGGKAMFLIWVCLIYMSFPGTFSIIPAEVGAVCRRPDQQRSDWAHRIHLLPNKQRSKSRWMNA